MREQRRDAEGFVLTEGSAAWYAAGGEFPTDTVTGRPMGRESFEWEGATMNDAQWEQQMQVRRTALNAADSVRDLIRLDPTLTDDLTSAENRLRRIARLADNELRESEGR